MIEAAEEVKQALSSSCYRIEIAGSLRRREGDAGDIEFVAVPKLFKDFVGDMMYPSPLDLKLQSLDVEIAKNGNKYKQLYWNLQSGLVMQADLFLQPDPATWGVNFMLRTGDAKFSHLMVTKQMYGGYMPDQYNVREARVWENSVALPTPEEESLFELWGMDYIKPENRKRR